MFVKVLSEIEKKFNIRFDDDEIDANNFKTIGTLAKIIESKIS